MQISLPNFALFTVKSPSVTQRSVSQENALKRAKAPVAFVSQNYGLKKLFDLIENNLGF